MATKIRHVKAIIQLRRGPESDWERVDPTLMIGEAAYSTDVNKLKIGDGAKPWTQLEYLNMTESEIREILETYATKEYVDEKTTNVTIDCGTSTTNIWEV